MVLPPLLFAATQRTTAREFRDHAGAVLLLAVGLTLATAGAVAVVVHLAGLSWSAAFVLGAVVSPPGSRGRRPRARRPRLPDRLVTILEGEGMFNDATALVAFKVAVAATVTGHLSVSGTAAELLVAIVVGTGVGLLAGWVTKVVLAAIEERNAETTVTVLVPFVAYVGAERLWTARASWRCCPWDCSSAAGATRRRRRGAGCWAARCGPTPTPDHQPGLRAAGLRAWSR